MELAIVKRVLVAAASLTIDVLESDDAVIPATVRAGARDVQALFGELNG